MSRRTRTKMRPLASRNHSGTNHHTQYSSSTSYFPKCYSIIGEQIKFPHTVLPFHMDGKITYFGDLQTFQYKVLQYKVLQNEQMHNQIHTVNIGIRGQVVHRQSKLNLFIFIISMLCCCISCLFSKSYYRSLFFTKYNLSVQQYKLLFSLISHFPNTKHLMITFQDNFINNQKMQIINSSFKFTKVEQLTVRNLCYYINSEEANINERTFQKFSNIKDKQIKFWYIWQKNLIQLNQKQNFNDQKQNLLYCCDQI